MLLLLLPIVTSSGVHQIPLQLHHNYSALQRQLRASRYDVRDLHGKVGPTPVSLFNVFGLACLSLINIGSPETTNIVDFHLSYSDSIILDKSVRGLTNYNARQDHANLSIPVHYGDDISGYWATDNFEVPLTELSSPRQPFVWINRDESRAFIDWFLPTLGLAPPVNSNSFLHRIKDKLREPLLSLYFEPIRGAHPIAQAMSLTFGGVDNHCRRRSIFYTDYVNVTVFDFFHPWAFRMRAISFAGGANDSSELNIRVNAVTGIFTFPMIIGPKKYIKRIAHRLGGHKTEGDFEYEIGCAKRHTNPPVWIHIGSKTITLTAKDYILKIGDDDSVNNATTSYTCYLAFQSRLFDLNFGDTWYVGTPLFNSKCLVLDFGKNRIGFATPKKARDE
ncbi:Cathepsin D [Aphelenchoides avenae]|nr:Cathepsin D [Aphelenchus avenae]